MKWTTVATVLAFLAIPTIASAHAGNNDPNMVHACIGNVSKIVRIVGVSGSCLTAPPLLAETPAHWPQVQGTGSQGPKGDQGDPGTPGTNGTNGTNGTDGTNGAPGTNGTDGIDGTNGTNGTNGIDGTNGTRADAPCFHNTNRYVNCGNGTVTDTVTGLIWRLRHVDRARAHDPGGHPLIELIATGMSAARRHIFRSLMILRGRSFKRLTCGVGENEIPDHSSGR